VAVRPVPRLGAFLALVRLELYLARRLAPLRIAMLFLPLVMMVFLGDAIEFLVQIDGYPWSNGTEHGIAGLCVLFSFVNLPFLGWSAYDEHGFGTWDRIRSGFTPPWMLLAAKVTVMSGFLMTMFVLSFAGGLLLGMDVKGSVVAWFVLALAASVVASTYGLMLYVLLPTANMFVILSHAGSLVMGGFAGALVPFGLLPDWVQAVAPVLPQYWAVRGFDDVSLDGAGLVATIPELAVLALFWLLFLVVSIWRFRPDALKQPLSE
jgi:ABC-2 type transport system permease protein